VNEKERDGDLSQKWSTALLVYEVELCDSF